MLCLYYDLNFLQYKCKSFTSEDPNRKWIFFGTKSVMHANQCCMMASKRKREDDFEYAPSSAKMSKNEDSEYQRNFA